MAVFRGDRYTKHALHRHRMAAIAPVVEEATGAVPLTTIVVSGMHIVLAPKGGLETRKLNTLWLLGVTFGFRDFADHA